VSNAKNRVVERIAELGKLGRYEGGIDRPLASPAERAARERFAAWARADGYALAQDAAGNTFARRAGTRADLKPILLGSHLDTVKTGGAYDGAYGVIGAMCALELLDARGVATAHPVEAVAWAGEEGSRFPLGCLGSSAFAGLVTVDHVRSLRDEDGVAYADALASPEGGALADVAPRGDSNVAAYLELHVEQGPILEEAGVQLGIVTAIAGQRRLRCTVEGVSGHAGTVPMAMRADALCAASELVIALDVAARAVGDAVATVGWMHVEPNGTNVVPGKVAFSLDIRSPDDAKLDAIEAAFEQAMQRARASRGVTVTLEAFERRKPTPMTPFMREAIARGIGTLGKPSLDVPSGAGHDAMSLGKIVPTAMIFVPSIGGRSHVAEERTGDDDLELGVEALAAAVAEVDRALLANGA
jgi:hydantoinase/carbamoylase family amidase